MVALKQGPSLLPLLPLSFLTNGLATAHTAKKAAANRIGLTIVVCGVNVLSVQEWDEKKNRQM